MRLGWKSLDHFHLQNIRSKKYPSPKFKKKHQHSWEEVKNQGAPRYQIPECWSLFSWPLLFWGSPLTQSTSATIPGPKSPRAPSRLARKTWGFLAPDFHPRELWEGDLDFAGGVTYMAWTIKKPWVRKLKTWWDLLEATSGQKTNLQNKFDLLKH